MLTKPLMTIRHLPVALLQTNKLFDADLLRCSQSEKGIILLYLIDFTYTIHSLYVLS